MSCLLFYEIGDTTHKLASCSHTGMDSLIDSNGVFCQHDQQLQFGCDSVLQYSP